MTIYKDIFGFDPFEWQKKVLNDTASNVVVVGSRRVSKTTVALMHVVRVAIDFDKWIASRGNPGYKITPSAPAIIAVVSPTRGMSKTLHFQPMVKLLQGNKHTAKLIKNINRSDLRIDFYGNRPSIIFAGLASEGDRLRGVSIAALVVEETQDVSYRAIDESLKPAMLSVKGSQALYIGSAKGKGRNALYLLSEMCKLYPELYSFHRYSIFDNPTIPKDYISNERKTKSKEVFAREYLGSFSNFSGMVFTELSQGNIIEQPPEDTLWKHPKTGKPFIIVSTDFGSLNAAIVVLKLYKDPAGGCRWVITKAWQNLSGGHISCNEHNTIVLDIAKEANATFIYGDPANGDRVMDIRGLSGIPTMTGYNSIISGVNQIHSMLQQRKLCFSRDMPSGTNLLDADAVYDIFAAYRYATDREGTVVDTKIADGLNDHILDATRIALAKKDPRAMTTLLCGTKKTLPAYNSRLDPENTKYFDPGYALATSRRLRYAAGKEA